MKTTSPTIAEDLVDETSGPVRVYSDREFNWLELQWIERSGRTARLHFGGGYTLEIRNAPELHFFWPDEH